MLSVCHFNRCMNTLLTFAGIPVDEVKNNAWYNLMKNDFSDSEFSRICEDVCKTETLYGRYPEPKLFYSRYEQFKDKEELPKLDIALLEQQRKNNQKEQEERAEKMDAWLEFIKSKGYSSTVDVINSGNGNFKKLREEFKTEK
ncbi:MAG: hypothetical protein J6S85_05745 [Methanobrevibacter sp.]|nr:hypothetical protein [Methanobrevibacter sp.]